MPTTRAGEVWNLLARGYSNKQIGEYLNIHEKNVKTHITSLFKNIGVLDRLLAAISFYNPDLKLPQEIKK
jgi:DNA-binding NarL/FixJ family response regulator